MWFGGGMWDYLEVHESLGTIWCRRYQISHLANNMQSRSPIQISVLSGHVEVTEILIYLEGCNNCSDLASLCPCFSAASSELLLFAIKSNITEAVACLLDFGVDVNCSDALRQTPFYLAARSGNETFTSLLFRCKPVVDRLKPSRIGLHLSLNVWGVLLL